MTELNPSVTAGTRPQKVAVPIRTLDALLAAAPPPRLIKVDVEGFEPLVLRTAAAAGLNVTTGVDATGHLGFRIPDASSAALFGWMSALERDHGISVVSLGVVENTDATLQVEGVLSRQPG